MRNCSVVFFCLFCTLCLCQTQSFDSIFNLKAQHPVYEIHVPTEYTLFNDQLIRIDGLYWASRFTCLSMGTGVQWINKAFPMENGSRPYGLIAHFLYTEIQLYNQNRWNIGLRYMLGYGWNPNYMRIRDISFNQIFKNPFFVFYEPGASVQYQVNTWLGLQNDFIFRFCLNSNAELNRNMSQPAWILTFNINYSKLFKLKL